MTESSQCELTFELDGRAGRFRPESGRAVLGRSRDCDLPLPAEGVSRRHAELVLAPSGWLVRDLDSKNGVLLNGRRIQEEHLTDGDLIGLGTVELACHVSPVALPARVEVQLEDGACDPSVTGTLDLSEFDKLLTQPAPAASDPGASVLRDGFAVARIFFQASEALLASDDLDETLEVVLDLVFENLPVQRASLSMVERETLAITPVAYRARGRGTGSGMRISRTVARKAIESRQAVLMHCENEGSAGRVLDSFAELEIETAMCAPLYHAGQVIGLVYVDSSADRGPLNESHLEVLSALAGLAAVGISKARLREEFRREQAVRELLARYSSPAVVDKIVAGRDLDTALLAEEVEVSVLFADICDFTPLAERLGDPLEVTRVLNGAFEHLVEGVFEHEGTLDKFIGDEVMAFFGAPLPQPDHALRAVRCAQEMLRRLEEYNEAHPEQDPLGLTVGINTGRVVAGDIGTRERRDYTVIGDTVNIAKRIESGAAQRGRIAIGEPTHAALGGSVPCSGPHDLQLKGRRLPVRVWFVDMA